MEVDADGFYFSGPLTSGVWTVQVCNGGTQVGIRKLKSPLSTWEFDEEDFYL